MKKFLVLMLVCLMVFSLASCKGIKNVINDVKGEVASENEDDTFENEDGEKEDKKNDDANEKVGTWADLYNEYSDRLDSTSEVFSNAMESETDYSKAFLYMNYSLYIIYGETSLSATNGFFGEGTENENRVIVETYFKVLGSSDLDYKESGDTATLTGTGLDADFKYELKFDKKSKSAELIYTVDGEVSEKISICVTDEYVAKTFWSKDSKIEYQYVAFEDGAIRICFNENVASPSEDSLYKNAKLAQANDFGTSMSNKVEVEDGKIKD